LFGAIAGGNTCVVKPSEVSANTSALLAKLIPQYVDKNAVAVIEGAVLETQQLLALQWDHIMYTGNGEVGKVVMAAAAKYLTPVTLELGGKSPVYVDKSCDLNVTARRLVWGKFLNCGQTCVAPDYILVHRDVYEALFPKIKEALNEFYGSDAKKARDYSRIINERHTERLGGLLQGSGGNNGKILFGGKVEVKDRFIEPTVLRDVPLDSKIMEGEIFGPIMPFMQVSSVDEAIKIINSRPKPLALYVFTKDKSVADKVVAQTSAGGVCINETIMHVANETLPFGGVGPSGMGSYHGKFSFNTFTHVKPVLEKATWLDPRVRYPPYPADLVEQMQKLEGIIKAIPKVAAGVALVGGALLVRSKL